MHPFESTGYRGGLVKTDRIAGPRDGERWNWQEIIPAGATRTLLGLTHTPYKDAVLYYQSTAASTEACRLTIVNANTRCAMPLQIDVGPLGGGSIRLSGGITISATAENLLVGQAEIQIWICPAAQVQHVPPLTAQNLVPMVQGALTNFISPDPGSLGWCPARRPNLSFLSTQNCNLDFLDAAGGWWGRITYQPGVSNRELDFIHPPKLRLRVTNTAVANSNCAATWYRS
jgi:hypothetical protein